MSDIAESMIQGMKEALAFSEGQTSSGYVAHIPEDIDVQRIRKRFSMTQKDFSGFFGIELKTLQEWEQGRRSPSGASKNFLCVLDREPEAVCRALHIPHDTI